MIAPGRTALLAAPVSTTPKYTELEWNLKFQAPATVGETYEFRVYAEDIPFGTYAVTPQLTVSTGAATYNETGRSVLITAAVTSTDKQGHKEPVRSVPSTGAVTVVDTLHAVALLSYAPVPIPTDYTGNVVITGTGLSVVEALLLDDGDVGVLFLTTDFTINSDTQITITTTDFWEDLVGTFDLTAAWNSGTQQSAPLVLTLAPPASFPAPTLYYDFAETGTTAIDRTGNGNDGALLTNTTPTDLHSSGVLLINATNENLMYVPTTSPVTHCSYTATIVTSAVGGTGGSIWTLAIASDTSGHRLNFDGADIAVVVRAASGVFVNTVSGVLHAGENKVATTYDGTTYRLYVDAVEVFNSTGCSGALQLTPLAGTGFHIGMAPTLVGVGGSWTIDDVRWWDTVTLTPEEVAAVASGGAPATGTNYNETGKSIAITATVTLTDQVDWKEPTLAVPITAVVTSTDKRVNKELTLSVPVTAAVTTTDILHRWNLGLSVPIVAAVTSTDQVDFKNTTLSVPVIVAVTVNDAFGHLGNFSDLNLSIPISGAVASTDKRNNKEPSLSVPIVASVTQPTNQADFHEPPASVPVVATVTVLTDSRKVLETALSISATGAVTTPTNQAHFREPVSSVPIVAFIGRTDQQTSPGHFDETQRQVLITASITLSVDQADYHQLGLSVAAVVAITAADTAHRLETALAIPVVATVTRTDTLSHHYTEARSVLVTAAVTSTDRQHFRDLLDLPVAAPVSLTTDKARFKDLTRSVDIAATVALAEGGGGAEILSILATATVTRTDRVSNRDALFLTASVTVTSLDSLAIVAALLKVLIVSKLTMTDFKSRVGVTVLNDAAALYLGSQVVDAVYVGPTKVWP